MDNEELIIGELAYIRGRVDTLVENEAERRGKEKVMARVWGAVSGAISATIILGGKALWQILTGR